MRTFKQKYQYLILGCFIVIGGVVFAQPVAYTKLTIGAATLYKDLKKDKLYYYAPGNLVLNEDETGKPAFQLLQMRYTGTKLASAIGEKRFTNIVQFGVKMKSITSSEISEIKKQLGSGISLRPLPVRNIEMRILIPAMFPGDEPQFLQGEFSSQATQNGGNSDKKSYWTERTFTHRLDNPSAQLLWEQVENNRLSISVNYVFFGEMIDRHPGEIETSDSTITESLVEQLGEEEPILIPFKSETFAVEIDPNAWPDILKKIDINESLPPVYPTLEVKCYDFQNEALSDILIKKVEMKATSVNGDPLKLPTIRFSRDQPDLHTHLVSSPYAITMSKPLFYKVTTIRKDGTKNESSWNKTTSWHDLIDVTTLQNEVEVKTETLEFEYDTLLIKEGGFEAVYLYLYYDLRDQTRKQKVMIYPNDHNSKQLKIRRNKAQLPRFQVVWKHRDGSKVVRRRTVVRDDYYYLSIPK